MGENLALNMLNHGYKVAVFNRTVEKVRKFVEEGRGREFGGEGGEGGGRLVGCYSAEEFCLCLERPRKIILLVQVWF